MIGRDFDPRYEAVTETATAGVGRQTGRRYFHEATITGYENERVEVSLGDHAGGFLILSDTYYPGWKAWVDDEEMEILPVNHVFRGVPVRPGSERVEFVYDPSSFTLGAWISVIATCLFALLLTFGWQRGFASGPEVIISAHRFKAWTLQILLIVVIHALVNQWPDWSQSVQRSNLTNLLGG